MLPKLHASRKRLSRPDIGTVIKTRASINNGSIIREENTEVWHSSIASELLEFELAVSSEQSICHIGPWRWLSWQYIEISLHFFLSYSCQSLLLLLLLLLLLRLSVCLSVCLAVCLSVCLSKKDKRLPCCPPPSIPVLRCLSPASFLLTD